MKNPREDPNTISRRDFVRATALAANAVTTGLAFKPLSGRAATADPP